MNLPNSFKLKQLFLNSLIGACCLGTTAVAAEETITQRLEKLEKQLAEHKKKDNGFHILNKVRFAGLVHMDHNHYDGAYNASADGKSGSDVFVRRVHIRLFHKANDKLDYVMLLLPNDSDTVFLVGFARYQPNNTTEFRIGKIKEDRSLSVQYIGEELIAERPMVANAFATAFQWGVQGHKLLGNGFRVSGGIFEDKKYAGNKDGRDADNKLLLGYNVRGTWSNTDNNSFSHLGLSYGLRDIGGDSFSLSERAGIRQATNRLAVAPTLSSADDVSIVMAEAAFQAGPFMIEGEYGAMDVDSMDSNIDDLSMNGYYVQASYFLDGKTSRAYNKKYAKIGRPSNENSIWEIYGRYSVLDLADNSAGTKAEVGMLGATYYINKHMYIQMQYYDAEVSGPGTSTAPFTNTDGDQFHDGTAIATRVSYRF